MQYHIRVLKKISISQERQPYLYLQQEKICPFQYARVKNLKLVFLSPYKSSPYGHTGIYHQMKNNYPMPVVFTETLLVYRTDLRLFQLAVAKDKPHFGNGVRIYSKTLKIASDFFFIPAKFIYNYTAVGHIFCNILQQRSQQTNPVLAGKTNSYKLYLNSKPPLHSSWLGLNCHLIK